MPSLSRLEHTNTMKNLITPAVLLGVILSLVGVIYANQQKIDDRQDAMDEKLLETKVDNVTMQLMIEKQSMLIQNYKAVMDEQKQELKEYKKSVESLVREIQAERLSRGGKVVIMNEPVKVKKIISERR